MTAVSKHNYCFRPAGPEQDPFLPSPDANNEQILGSDPQNEGLTIRGCSPVALEAFLRLLWNCFSISDIKGESLMRLIFLECFI